MAFPSTLSSLTDPQATDRLNNPSHSAIERAQNTAIEQIEAVIGVEGASSVVGSLEYFIKSPDSNGGGHVQTANKGGTGQTTFTKGDMFVATSASAIAKLAVGADGQAIVADSSVAAGLKWGTPGGTKIQTNASIITVAAAERSILSAIIPGSTLGTSNAVRSTSFVKAVTFSNPYSVLTRAFYGGGITASVMMVSPAGYTAACITGKITYTIIANNSNALQRNMLLVELQGQHPNPLAVTSVVSIHLYDSTASSVLSDANQTMGMTIFGDTGGGNTRVDVDGTIIEKIV